LSFRTLDRSFQSFSARRRRGNQLENVNVESVMTVQPARRWVARFALLAMLATGCGSAPKPGSSPRTAPPSTTIVSGRVTASPTCGGPAACPLRPVVGPVEARDAGGRRRASAHSDRAGRYQLALPPGSYTLFAIATTAMPTCAPVTVTLGSEPVHADIACDTGLR
jgi:hypothetical protein